MRMHDDELEIDAGLVRALVARARPDLAGREVRALGATGSSNALFRLGDDLLVRLPRRPGGSGTIAKEARLLPRLAPALPVAVPVVVAIGEPGLGYPERWSIVRWIRGRPPGRQPDGPDGERLAAELAAFVVDLRAAPLPDRAADDPELRWYRGGPLSGIDADVRDYAAQCRRLPDLDLDVDACLDVWTAAVAQPGDPGVARWLHGDLLAENLLMRAGRLTAVLDFGGLAIGDPSVDLVAAWDVLGPAARVSFRTAVGADDAAWQRGRGWALAIALMTFPYYWRSLPQRCAGRLAMARAVLADEPPGTAPPADVEGRGE